MRKLTEATANLRVMRLRANCDQCGAEGAARYSARYTPVGETWVGGKEAYKSCCDECFDASCYFTNPLLLLDNPAFYQEHRDDILAALKLPESEFCEAVGAAIAAMRAGARLEVLTCQHCDHLHLDKEWYAVHAHHKHLCEVCEWVTEHGLDSVGNPLALLKLTLVEGKLHLDWQGDSESEATAKSPSVSLVMRRGKAEAVGKSASVSLDPLKGLVPRGAPLIAAPVATAVARYPVSDDSLLAPRDPVVESDVNGKSATSPTVADLAR